MQSKITRNYLVKLSLLVVLVVVLTGCIKEDLTNCKPDFEVVNIDITENHSVETVMMYVFDKNGVLLGKIFPKPGEPIELAYPGYDDLTLVSWGNGDGPNIELSDIEIGETVDMPFFQLIRVGASPFVTKSGQIPVVLSPDDIFYGSISIHRGSQSMSKEIVLHRVSSKVSFVAYKMLEYFGSQDAQDFHITVGQTKDKLNFRGEDYGDDVCYKMVGSKVNDDAYVVNPFNILKTNAELVVNIYYKNELVYTIDKNKNGAALTVQPGEQLNIEATFTIVDEDLVVNVELAPAKWGEAIAPNKDF